MAAGENNPRPRNARSGEPIGPLSQPGYYPGYRSLDQQNFWDDKTREVVLARVENIPPIRFFTPDEAALMTVICEHIIPQSDRDDAHRIPIVPHIDLRLFEDRSDGYRFEDMPSDQEAYRLGLSAIEMIARHLHGRSFIEADAHERDQIMKSLHDAKPTAGAEIWKRVPVDKFWMMLVQDCVEVYYAHPWAWDEIGFGGPAYPRAYMRLENGEPEPWEVDERRYRWQAPDGSVSDVEEPVAGTWDHISSPGRGGTH